MQLSKGGNAPLDHRRLMLVLNWAGHDDVDVAALLLGADGRVRSDDDFIFYNQPQHRSEAVTHLGKAPGVVNKDSIGIDLDQLEPAVERIIISASAGGTRFGQLSGLELHVLDANSNQPVLTYSILDASVETAMIAGEVYRRNGAWKFRAVGQGYESGLKGVATDYGITVEDDELVPEQSPPPPPVPGVASTPAVAPKTATPARAGATLPVPASAPPTPVAAAPVVDSVADEVDVTLRPFDTDNPYLRRLFTMKEFGRAPGRALQIYQQRVIDPDERMLAAFKSQHGRMRWGYLILTTDYLRWIQTLPLQDEEMYEYNDRIEQVGTMIRLPTGDQYQLKGFGAGRKFKAIFQVAQQASLWTPR